MRTNTADQHMVTVEHQMLRGDSGRQQFIAVTHILGGIFGGDMLKDHLQAGQALAQRLHHGFNKARFAVENINLGVGDFAMYQQRHPQFSIRSSTGIMASVLVTPWLELVVALAG